METAMPPSPQISVLIVTYKTREMTLRCLRDLMADLEGISSEVLVVDNDSKDGIADAIALEFPLVRLICNSQNVGFGTANNQAMELATGQVIMMLNTDAFVHPGCCRELLSFLSAHPDVGVVGSKLLNEDGTVQTSCFPFPTPYRAWVENLGISKLFKQRGMFGDYRKWKHDEVKEVDWVVGACLACRREVIQQVGGFDPLFFMYSEETDWQRRIRRAGWRIYINPAAVTTHLGGASGTREIDVVNRHFFTSLDHYLLKHHGWLGFVAVRVAMFFGCSCRLLFWTCATLAPKVRARAVKKLRRHAWLVRRQLFTGMPQPAPA